MLILQVRCDLHYLISTLSHFYPWARELEKLGSLSIKFGSSSSTVQPGGLRFLPRIRRRRDDFAKTSLLHACVLGAQQRMLILSTADVEEMSPKDGTRITNKAPPFFLLFWLRAAPAVHRGGIKSRSIFFQALR